MSASMLVMADFVEDRSGETPVIRFSGRLTLARIGDIPKRLEALTSPPSRVDLSQIERIDTVGAWVVRKLALEHDADIIGASPDALHLIEQVGQAGSGVQVRPHVLPPLSRVLSEIGTAVVEAGRTLVGLTSFLGTIILSTFDVIRHPSRFRANAVIQRFELVGINALAIVGLMSFLIGLVIAQQGAAQLAEFGAQNLTVNLVGRITTRELGILMTAIMVAGRSGSAFAAQIGTMKLTEEIDAMRTIGVSPIEALVLPRFFAAVIMMPLIGFFASIMSIIGGGLFCWASLHLAPGAYVEALRDAILMTDMYVGMIKAPVFGAIIAITGCYQGMQVEGNAEQVGLRTTAAVVQAIFLVIVIDAFFAVFFQAVGWD
jgi:phospholipid/cholesterol/gamma-HCH transport system permease protein